MQDHLEGHIKLKCGSAYFFVNTNCHFQYWKDKRKRTKAVQSALKGDFHLYMLTCIPANFWHFFLVGRVRRQLLLQCFPFNVFRDVWIRTLRAVAETMRSSPYLSTRPPKKAFTSLQMKDWWIQYKCLVPIYVFPEMKLFFPKQNYNVLSLSSYTHISVRDLYISRIGQVSLFCCSEKLWNI
jgi:hypothetical protein